MPKLLGAGWRIGNKGNLPLGSKDLDTTYITPVKGHKFTVCEPRKADQLADPDQDPGLLLEQQRMPVMVPDSTKNYRWRTSIRPVHPGTTDWTTGQLIKT